MSTQECVELLGPGLARREVRRGVGDRRRVLHYLAPPQLLHMARDLDHLMKTGKCGVPVQYLTCPADALCQATVTEVRGAAFVDDGGVIREGQLDVFEEFGRVVLIFVR